MEILVVIGVTVLLVVITLNSFSNLNRREALKKEALQVASIFDQARSLTLSSKKASKYGVHLEADKVTIFQGDTYSSGDPGNITTSLNPLVTITNIELSGGGSDLVFDRLTGATSQYGTTTISLSSDLAQTKSVIIYPTGVSEIK